jgi:hypothetical protein
MLALALPGSAGWVILTLVAVALVLAVAAYFGKKRAAALQEAAAEIGFSFERKGAVFRAELSPSLYLLRLGRGKTLSNVIRGPGATLFDYRYQVGGGDSTQSISQTVAAFRFPPVLPEFHLGPENILHKLAGAFGYQLIRFETHPEFSRRYLLRGPDEAAVRAFFRPPLLDYFQSLPEKPVWNVEAAGPWLLLYHAKKKVKPAELRSFLDATRALADEIGVCTGLAREAGPTKVPDAAKS